MDAKVGDWVVTPRSGKPVEIQALWLNALRIGPPRGAVAERWRDALRPGRAPRSSRASGTSAAGWLFDVVDVDHVPGTVDASFRPNQIFAVGGLPFAVLDGERARAVVDAVEARLLTPLGLRTLAPERSAATAPRYGGGVRERDSGYHQGTVWPWLLGPFVEAWVRVRGGTAAARAEARARFLQAAARVAPTEAATAGARPRGRRRRAAPSPRAAAPSRPGPWARRCGSTRLVLA